MNWLDRFVRSTLSVLGERKSGIEEDDKKWHRCPLTGEIVFEKDLAANLWVFASGHHCRMPMEARLQQLFDEGRYETVVLPEAPGDPLKFRDRKRYIDRLREARTRTGQSDAIHVASGRMGGIPLVVAGLDFDFMGGSMGAAVGSGFVAAAELAVKQQAAFLAITASGGARMQEGIVSLMQLPRTILALQMVKQAGLPYIVLLCDPTTGGVSASFAMLGDIHLAEPGATIGFAGRRVIEQTMGEQPPEEFQMAEYLYRHGFVDMIVPRREQRPTLIRLIALLTNRPAVDIDRQQPEALQAPLDASDAQNDPVVTTDTPAAHIS